MASPSHQSYGFKAREPLAQDLCQGFVNLEVPAQPSLCSGQGPFLQAPASFDQEEQQQVVVASNDLPVSDMDLANFLEMDDKTLSELTGVNSTEWNSLFNGQLDDVSSLDPSTGLQNPDVCMVSPSAQSSNCLMTAGGGGAGNCTTGQQPPHIDRWLIEETQKLERQQKLQQQKLMELQQTLLKTEILKNQLQIATISSQAQSPTMSTASSLLLEGFGQARQQGPTPSPPQQKQQKSPTFNLSPNPGLSPGEGKSSLMFPQNSPSMAAATWGSSVSMASSVTSRGGRMSTSSAHSQASSPDVKPTVMQTETPPPSPPSSTPNSPEEPCKRKVHNLIEKKYRCSINDRICLLREMVSKHSKDNKKLQKSAVLQKTIDFIHHLQNTIKKLEDENRQLREALARATGKSHMVTYYGSSPNTPPSGSESEPDSGAPSSPDEPDQISPGSKASFFTQFLREPVLRASASQYLMVVMLVAVFFVNPLAFVGGPAGGIHHVTPHIGAARTILGSPDEPAAAALTSPSLDTLMYVGFLALRVLVACLCFGWMTLKSVPRIMANSQDSVHFWRLRKQAEKDLEQGDFMQAKDNLETALSVINRPIPTSYLGMTSGLLWSLFSHLLFQLVIGRCAVHLASMFIWRKAEKDGTFNSPKKPVFGVTFDDVSETYHLLHQINLASSSPAHLHGMGFFLALNALNFAEADRPFQRLGQLQVGEMYFALGLQCHNSIPYAATLPMWYYFFCFRNVSPSKYATPLKWAMTEPGMSFLLSGKWASDVAVASRLYVGNAALPSFSVTRAYCKELLCESFGSLLLPYNSPDQQKTNNTGSSSSSRDSDTALQAFKVILNLAKEANACLLNDQPSENKNIKGAAGCSDSGFTVIQWWASVGIVSCHWLADEESSAQDYYPNIEALSGEMGAAVPSALQLAFKANRMYKRPCQTDSKVPLDVVVQLCTTTSNSLESSVTNLLQDHSSSAETELHQLGLLQACDWLLSLKVTLWENHEKKDGIAQKICPGFYQDLETLSKLVTLLPSARSRVHLYKGCYQLIAGANPITAEAMLNSTASASLVRRRTSSKDSSSPETPPPYSHEHAMAQLVAYKHLPASMEMPHPPPPPPSPTKRGFAPQQAKV